VFIYFIEEHPDYLPIVEPLFVEVAAGHLQAVTSAVTLLETLVVPYRAGDQALADRYESLLTRSGGLELIDLDRPLLRAGAQLRARFGVKTPDALQLAAALRRRCSTFVTNDRRMPTVPGIRVLELSSCA
jgi:predicted nucleic acid-binding protein